MILFLLSLVIAAGCHGSADPGPPNYYPIFEASEGFQLVKTVANGSLYNVTVPNNGTAQVYRLMHVYGGPYDWGFAQGQLLADVLPQFMNSVWSYMESQITTAIPSVPNWLADLIAELGLDAALDYTYAVSVEYTNPDVYTELQGLADGCGDPSIYWTAVKIHQLAGFTQGQCSMYGMWSEALDPSLQGHLLQLRALDWDMGGPFRDYSQITVYHPDPEYGHAFANIGFSGFIGGLTGISQSQLGISEIGVAYPDSTFGSMSRIGVPFIFLLRDILQYDETVDDATNRMINTRRTCDLILGVGDGKLTRFNGYEYSYSVLNVFDPLNLEPYNETWHPRIDNIVYWGMDWICPAYNYVLSQQLLKYYGKMTPEISIRYITAVEQSGDNHLAVYDLTTMEFWTAFAAPNGVDGPVAAFSRQFAHYNATQLFSEPRPSILLLEKK